MIVATHGIIANSVTLSTLNNSLYAVYKAESNANDLLGVYNGTAVGGLTYTTGKSGNAFNFNGSNANVNLPYNSFNSLYSSDFSFNCWINLASISTRQALFSNYSYSSSTGIKDIKGFRIYYGASGTSNIGGIRIDMGDSINNNVILLTNNYLSINTWYMITITRKANFGTKIYINNTLSVQDSNTINPGGTNTYPSLGAVQYQAGSYEWYMSNGSKLDEVNIWNKELTSTEVTELYNSGSGKFYPY
jgi:hypothetical protein